MSQFSCLIQEGSPADERSGDLQRCLAQHHADHYPGELARVDFRSVPAGTMFTEGRPSTSSIITVSVAHQTTLEERERYMRGICDLWTDITGCTNHEIVVAVTETEPSAKE